MISQLLLEQVLSIVLALVLGYLARHKGITVPGTGTGGDKPDKPLLPGLPDLPGIDLSKVEPGLLLRAGLGLVQKRREARRRAAAEEDAVEKMQEHLPE